MLFPTLSSVERPDQQLDFGRVVSLAPAVALTAPLSLLRATG
jgi:hypothetical protein